MNLPIYIWIALVGGLAIGFVIGAEIGHRKGISKDFKLLSKAQRLTRVFVEE